VVAAFTREIAESKATEGTTAGRQAGHPLEFTTEPEE
jgi:ATP-dependent Clp protease adaptor protein ClpS